MTSYRTSHRVLSVLVVTVVASRAVAGPPPLSVAIKKSHAAIDRAKAGTDQARVVVDASKALAGTFTATIGEKKFETKSGKTIIKGTITVARRKPVDYRTEGERIELTKLSSQLASAKSALAAVSNGTVMKETANQNERIIPPSSDRKREAENQVTKCQAEHASATKRIDRAVAERRKQCEVVTVAVEITDQVSKSIDLDKLALQATVSLSVRVVSYEIGSEIESVGGAPRITHISLAAVGATKE